MTIDAQEKGHLTNLELAALSYKESAREQQTRRTPAKPALINISKRLPDDLWGILGYPPTKEEAAYLSPDMQTLLMDLEHGEKCIQAIPRLEQSIRQIRGQMYQAMADQKPDKYNDLKMSLENEERTLGNVTQQVADITRSAHAYNKNAQEDIARSKETLKTLRTELSAPYSLQEAKDGLDTHTKPVVAWLHDLKHKGSPDERIEAMDILTRGGVDAKSMLTEQERQKLSPLEKAVAEQRDSEGKPYQAGATISPLGEGGLDSRRGQQTPVGSEKPSSQGQNSGYGSPGE